jgi:GNAT superfamily N-acetyltransferase
VERFFAWARNRGARAAQVSAFAVNERAQRFYERHGFVPQSVSSRVTL